MMYYFDTPLFVYMPIIFFIYGMSFFMLGVVVAIEGLRPDTPGRGFEGFVFSPLGSLAFFGMIQGLAAFMGVWSILSGGLPLALRLFRICLMSLSFFFLCRFGASYVDGAVSRGRREGRPQAIEGVSFDRGTLPWFSLPNILAAGWIVLGLLTFAQTGYGGRWAAGLNIFSRYLIGVPGSIMASVALWKSGENQPRQSRNYAIAASTGFAFYALGLLIGPKADFPPASSLNYETFYLITHIPTQVFRTVVALALTFSLLRLFRLSKHFSGIRYKAVMHVLIAVAVPAFCIVLLVCYLAGDALLRLSYRDHEKFAAMTAAKVRSYLDDADETVKYYVLFSRLAPSVYEKDIFLSLVRENDDIDGIAFYDEKGELLRAKRERGSLSVSYRRTADSSRLNAFLEGFTPKMPVNNFYISGHDRNNIFMTLPLAKGHIDVLLDVNRIYSRISAPGLEKGWHFLLLDDKRQVVFPLDRLHNGKEDTRQYPVRSPGVYGRKTVESGVCYNAIEGKISPLDWSVIVEIPRSAIVAPIFNVFGVLLVSVLLVNLSAIVVAVLFVGKTTKPINLIAERVKSIGREDFVPQLNIRTGDELQILSEEVEKMAVLLAEKKRMEKKIAQTEKIASLGRLVAGVAHEINNPLGIILGYSQLLQRECGPDGKHAADLKKMEKHALACKKIVEDLLKFSRVNRQTNIEVDIRENIRESLSLIEKHFSRENVTINFNDTAGSLKIVGDPDRLHQLFLNLALNALDSMKDGGTLTVTVRQSVFGDGKGVEVTFEDTGCGIREEDMGRIFDPFFTTKEVGKGTGLGLAVSYGIVDDHGGRIYAESEPGKGATFHILFPALKETEEL
jgi:signal transduction histidine kinase